MYQCFVGWWEQNVPINALKSLRPCKMDALVRCKSIIAVKGCSNNYSMDLSIVSMSVLSNPADYMFSPAKSYFE